MSKFNLRDLEDYYDENDLNDFEYEREYKKKVHKKIKKLENIERENNFKLNKKKDIHKYRKEQELKELNFNEY